MGVTITIGIVLLGVSIILFLAGLIVLIAALLTRNKKNATTGLKIMAAAAVSLLASFSLCSMGAYAGNEGGGIL